MKTLNQLKNEGYNLTDKICVFCSMITDSSAQFCGTCNEYKGMMSIRDAVNYYGSDILGF